MFISLQKWQKRASNHIEGNPESHKTLCNLEKKNEIKWNEKSPTNGWAFHRRWPSKHSSRHNRGATRTLLASVSKILVVGRVSNGQTTFDSRRRNWVQFKLVTRGIANIRWGHKLTSFLAWVRLFGAWGHLLVSCRFFFLPFPRAGPWVEWRQLATFNRLGNLK